VRGHYIPNGQRIYPKEKRRARHEPETFTFHPHYDYTFRDLKSYQPLQLSEIGGPRKERPIIQQVSELRGLDRRYLPINNIAWAPRKFGKYEVDLMQDGILLSHGQLITLRYEVKAKETWNSEKIRKQLSSIKGVHPVWVEQSYSEGRLDWLIERVGDIALGFILFGEDISLKFNLKRITKPRVMHEMIDAGFNGSDLELLMTTYSLFSQLVGLKLSFNGERLFTDYGSFSLESMGETDNVVLSTKPQSNGWVDSTLCLNPQGGQKLITHYNGQSPLLKYL